MVKAAGKSSISARKSEATKTAKKTTKTAVKTTKKKATSTKKTRTSAQKTAEKDEKTEKNEAVSNEARRKRLIRNEVRRLSDTFKEIPSEKKRLVKATIDDVAFLSVSMQELRDQINREGMEIKYQNGANQWGTKQSPSVLSYLQMSQKLAAAMKILLDCQPKAEVKETDDKFDDFVVMRGDD
ncbi:MAG: hypothetical protein K6B44_07835 [Lachnospiraceae bacterium]|nr:hypothetical protein [Lachnospiraceae bacterium]